MKKTSMQTKEFLPVVKELLKTQQVRLTVTGNSMLPFFKDKETIVTIESVDNIQLRKFDVILFEINDHLVLHRIIKLGTKITTQGDALRQKETTPLSGVLGLVTSYQHKSKIHIVRSRKHILCFKIYSIKKRIKNSLKKLLEK